MVGGELEPEEKEELAEKIGKLLQRDRMGVRTKLGKRGEFVPQEQAGFLFYQH